VADKTDKEELHEWHLRIVEDARKATLSAVTTNALFDIKSAYLGKDGFVGQRLKEVGKAPAELRKEIGTVANTAKQQIESLINDRHQWILDQQLNQKLAAEAVDVTLPGRKQAVGGLHPITRAQEHAERLFRTMGFEVADGPEIESDWYNFTALRMPPDHPSRSMQDTFYIAGTQNVLRTQTSPVQIRWMESHPPPIRIICPGRVYRNDHDATHSPMFHQIEGLWIDEGISLADLKSTVTDFCRAFFEREEIDIRFRPSYFPFVEPGVEIDMAWSRKDGEVTYLEIAGAGVVHPDVLRNGGIDPQRYSGFAFGMGLDRLAMLKYGVDDLRLFFENDLKFLAQFR
jgi:phenylalanyl-tRNA synthetase alpha chain